MAKRSKILTILLLILAGLLLVLFINRSAMPSHARLTLTKAINIIHPTDYHLTLTSIAADRIATAHTSNHIRIYTFSGETIFVLEPLYTIHCLQLSEDGKYLAVHADDSKHVLKSATDGIEIYQVDNKQLIRKYPVLTCPMALSSDGQQLAVLNDLRVSIFNKDQEQQLGIIEKRSHDDQLIFSPDGSLLALIQEMRSTTVWRASDSTRLYQIEEPAFTNGIQFSPDSNLITVQTVTRIPGCYNGFEYELQLRQATTGNIIKRFDSNSGIYDSSFSVDSRRLALSSRGQIVIWHIDGYIWNNINSGFWQSRFQFFPFKATLSPNSRYIVFENQGRLELRLVSDDQKLASIGLQSQAGIRLIKFSADSSGFVLVDQDQQIYFYKIQDS